MSWERADDNDCADAKEKADAPVEFCGLQFPNAIGLAAGYDKHGTAWPAAAALGFGHVEIGTVTLHAQPGNPRPYGWEMSTAEGDELQIRFDGERPS